MSKFKSLNTFCNKEGVTLVAVTKTRPLPAIMELYDQGQRNFGENRVGELVEKQTKLPKDIKWHMIGHLQSKKVKEIVPFVDIVHSGDRISVLKELNKQAEKNNRSIDVLLQLKIATEDSKYGWAKSELFDFIHSEEFDSLENLNWRGVMGMATFTEDKDQVRKEFKMLKSIFEELKTTYFNESKTFDSISMGMSGDYKIAIEEGATIIRVGSLLFS